MDFDRIIRNGQIYDGSGTEPYCADVGITGKTIAAIGDLSASNAKHVTDAAGRAVTPGFIDAHRHADTAICARASEKRSSARALRRSSTATAA